MILYNDQYIIKMWDFVKIYITYKIILFNFINIKWNFPGFYILRKTIGYSGFQIVCSISSIDIIIYRQSDIDSSKWKYIDIHRYFLRELKTSINMK